MDGRGVCHDDTMEGKIRADGTMAVRAGTKLGEHLAMMGRYKRSVGQQRGVLYFIGDLTWRLF